MSPPDGMERLNEFPFVLTQEEVVQDSHGGYQVVVNSDNPAYWYFLLSEVPINNRKREIMWTINKDEVDNFWDILR